MGGFLEVSLIVHSVSKRSARALAAVMLQQCPDAYQGLSWVGQEHGARVFIAWTGAHWVRARVKRETTAAIEAWLATGHYESRPAASS